MSLSYHREYIHYPSGIVGAKNTMYHLTSEIDVDASRLFIFENGEKGWPYDKLLEK